jgi:hypothetical protein
MLHVIAAADFQFESDGNHAVLVPSALDLTWHSQLQRCTLLQLLVERCTPEAAIQ